MTNERKTTEHLEDAALEDAQGGFELYRNFRFNKAPLVRDYELKVDPSKIVAPDMIVAPDQNEEESEDATHKRG